jgi:orotate phosphoribosyltransferase
MRKRRARSPLSTRNEAAESVLALVGGRRGHFALESGYHGDRWLDLETLCLRPRAIQPLASELAERLAPHRVDAICGPLTEGAFIALLIAAELGVDFLYADRVRRAEAPALFPVEYRLPPALRSRVAGRRIAIVNDVISAGSAVRGAFADLDSCGARVVALGALLVLGSATARFAAEKTLALEALATQPYGIWPPENCPLCAGGVPLEPAPDR